MRTQNEAMKYINKLRGYWWDWDGSWGAQCFDLANFYWYYVTGRTLKGLYAKDIPFENNFSGYANVIKNYDAYIPPKGSLVIFPYQYGEGAGHVAIVESANQSYFYSLDQNWYGGAQNNPPEVAQTIKHSYHPDMYFITPLFKQETTLNKIKNAVTPTKVKAPKFKPKKIMLVAGHGYNDPGAVGNGTSEKEFIRNNIVDNVAKYLKQAGHTVAIYSKNQDMYQDTAYGISVGDTKKYGLYWVKSQGYDTVVEFHLDAAGASASGGHVIIPSRFPADTIDNNIQNALKSTVGTIRGVTPRSDLLNCNVAGDININYRLVELGFITSTKDMNYIKDNLQTFTKEIAGAINGKPIGGTSAGKKKAGQTVWKWLGRFTPEIAIKVRTSPSLKGKVISNNVVLFTKVKTIKFNFIVKADGYWWISYTFKGKTYYSAICKITDKKERIKEEKYWGILKWNWHD